MVIPKKDAKLVMRTRWWIMSLRQRFDSEWDDRHKQGKEWGTPDYTSCTCIIYTQTHPWQSPLEILLDTNGRLLEGRETGYTRRRVELRNETHPWRYFILLFRNTYQDARKQQRLRKERNNHPWEKKRWEWKQSDGKAEARWWCPQKPDNQYMGTLGTRKQEYYAVRGFLRTRSAVCRERTAAEYRFLSDTLKGFSSSAVGDQR